MIGIRLITDNYDEPYHAEVNIRLPDRVSKTIHQTLSNHVSQIAIILDEAREKESNDENKRQDT